MPFFGCKTIGTTMQFIYFVIDFIFLLIISLIFYFSTDYLYKKGGAVKLNSSAKKDFIHNIIIYLFVISVKSDGNETDSTTDPKTTTTTA